MSTKKKVPFDGKFEADNGEGGKVTGEGKGEIIYEEKEISKKEPPPTRHGGSLHELGHRKKTLYSEIFG